MASQDWFEKDFYAVLGVPQDADEAAIKKAYRKLARKYHPDKNPGDAAAEKKFKEIGEANSVLSDKEQRQEYDAIRQMARGGARFTAGGPGGAGNGGFEDIFGDLFGEFFGGGARRSNRRRRGEDLSYTLTISFEEAAFGCNKEITVPRAVQCTECSGSGGKNGSQPTKCGTCRGAGQVRGPQGHRRHRRDHRRDGQGLGSTHLIERDLLVALVATLGVPGGAAVAKQDQPRHVRVSVIAGQSPQSRSSA